MYETYKFKALGDNYYAFCGKMKYNIYNDFYGSKAFYISYLNNKHKVYVDFFAGSDMFLFLRSSDIEKNVIEKLNVCVTFDNKNIDWTKAKLIFDNYN